ncbi:MAG TPA: hypothetical protein VK822_05460 [Acetobacteraceae bacterium]|jgi:hypothetical protein|nr:hypothetical protein [Acetobacteraceae bacterium]
MFSMKLIAASALAVAATCGVASAQTVPEGRVFVFHSKPTGTCPALDWHIVVGANNTLEGMIGWDDMKSMAKVTGSIGANRTFKMAGTRVSGGPGQGGATIDGQVRQDGWMVANIHGPRVDCQGIQVPWFAPPAPGASG